MSLPSTMGGPSGAGLVPLDYAYASLTWAAGMDKRTAPGPFAAAPMVQGDAAGVGQTDVLSLSYGTAAIASYFYPNFDPYQGSVVLWWTPEYAAGAANIRQFLYVNSTYGFWYDYTNGWFAMKVGNQTLTKVSAVTAGTLYSCVFRWDSKSKLDGTNYGCISVNDSHTFGVTTAPTVVAPGATMYIGSTGTVSPASGIVEAPTVYRRPLYDGTYGIDVGNGDEVNLIWAAGAGADPCSISGFSDVCFALPTNSTTGPIVTGTGEAWSAPHSSNALTHWTAEDGFYGGGDWAVALNGTTAYIDCGSDVGIDDLPAAGPMTIEAWVNGAGYIANKGHYSNNAGWFLRYQSTDATFRLEHATTDATAANATTLDTTKWHHVVGYYDNATLTASVAVDGKWLDSDTGAGAYQADAGYSLLLGKRWDAVGIFSGRMGWVRLSNIARYTPGTDFIPSRTPPAADGNTVAQWNMTEGTGATIDNIEGTAARDGTITNGTWERQWNISGTPKVLPVLDYNGTTTSTVIADAAAIQNLADNAFMAEAWVRADGAGESSVIYVLDKGRAAGKGWSLYLTSDHIRALIECATTDAFAYGTFVYTDGRWHLVTMQYDDAGDRKIYLWVDGIPQTGTQTAGVGAVVADAGENLYLGARSDGTYTCDGALGGYARLRKVSTYTNGEAFVPNSMANPPAIDANTVWQTDYSDGAGTTLTDDSATGVNGTISNGVWYNTPDLATVAPGNRLYNWGYILGSDTADDGITQTKSGLTAGANYYCKLSYSFDPSGRGQPEVSIYDVTNSATIVDFTGPKLVGTHTTGASSATLVDTANKLILPNVVGWKLYNITDGSSTTVTACAWDGTATTITGVLAGGSENDWDVGDVYRLVPPRSVTESPWCEYFCFELPTTARNGSAADCTSIAVRVRNVDDDGLIIVHQIEMYANLVDNPSLETGAVADPWIPDGFSNSGLDSGDSVKETTIVHSGAASFKNTASCGTTEDIRDSIGVTAGKFFGMGGWSWGSGAAGIPIGGQTADQMSLQSALAGLRRIPLQTLAKWVKGENVFRAIISAQDFGIAGNTIAAYADDVYAITLDDVSLTVTPASQANSLENTTELRIDGDDTAYLDDTADKLQATKGSFRFKVRPRHNAADLAKFGNTPYYCEAYGAADNYIRVYGSAANTITLAFNDGGGEHTANWDCTGAWVAGTQYTLLVSYTGSAMTLSVDSVVKATITTTISFATPPTVVYYGSLQAGTGQGDSTYDAV